MQINTQNNINIQNLAAAFQSPKAVQNSKESRVGPVDATLRAKYADIIDRAIRGEDVNPQLVEEAKQMIASGKLDTPEGAKEAAQKLLQYGI